LLDILDRKTHGFYNVFNDETHLLHLFRKGYAR